MPRVLVVDDSATDRRLAGGLLQRCSSLSVAYATDGKDALRQLEHERPDVIVTDLIMPHLNGRQLTEAVRRMHLHIPLIIMTSKGNEEIAAKALEHGAASYVPKRRLAQDLLRTVRSVLSAGRDLCCHTALTHKMTKGEFAFVLGNDVSVFPVVINYLQHAISHMRLSDEIGRVRIGIALDEALQNAHYHGNLELSSALLPEDDETEFLELAKQRSGQSPYRDRKIFLEASLSPRRSTYVIRDEGPGFDIGRLPAGTDLTTLDSTTGRGVLLLRMFMDEVQFSNKGNEVTLIKYHLSRPESSDPSEP